MSVLQRINKYKVHHWLYFHNLFCKVHHTIVHCTQKKKVNHSNKKNCINTSVNKAAIVMVQNILREKYHTILKQNAK